jgi:hypothetical protein
MAITTIYPGALNTYVPMAQAALQTNYTQNPSMFSINQYVTVAPVPQMTGYYLYHDATEETRIDYSNLADFQWADGTYPQVNMAKGNTFVQYTCTRYRQMFAVGDLSAAQAVWSVLSDHAYTATMRLMTIRTYKVLTELTNTANWGSNYGTAASLGGGVWAGSSASNQYIRKSIQQAIVNIQKATNGTVQAQSLFLIVSPPVAYAMSQSPEIIDYLKQSFVAKESLQQTPNGGFNYGIPDPLYGIRVLIEDRVYNTGAHGAAATEDFILGQNAIIVARPGSLMGPLNTMSTCTLAMYQDVQMVLEHKTTALLTEGVLWDNYAVIVRPESGYLITNTLTAP